MAAAVTTWRRERALAAGVAVLLLALAASACERKNPLYLAPGKKEPPPGTANTPPQKPAGPTSAGAGHPALRSPAP
jgi:predicted small lipoprotein YifL